MIPHMLVARQRECWPIDIWPEADQHLWAAACRPATHFTEDEGALARLAPITLKKYATGYGRWLAVIAQIDPSVIELAPLSRFSKTLFQLYVDHLRASGNGDSTCINRIEELAACLKAFDKNFDDRLLRRAASVIRSQAKPVRSKSNLRTTEELVDLGFEIMSTAYNPLDYKDALAFRDGLLIAFLALHPLRRRNLVQFLYGRNLIKQGDGFLVSFSPAETKTQSRIEVHLADALVTPMTEYLDTWRPILASRSGRWAEPIEDAVWVSADGSPLSEEGLSGRIEHWTRQKFGKAINPHLFRDAAATTMVINDPCNVRVAAPLLSHRSLATTEKYYFQATGLEAQRAYLATLDEILDDQQNRPTSGR